MEELNIESIDINHLLTDDEESVYEYDVKETASSTMDKKVPKKVSFSDKKEKFKGLFLIAILIFIILILPEFSNSTFTIIIKIILILSVIYLGKDKL